MFDPNEEFSTAASSYALSLPTLTPSRFIPWVLTMFILPCELISISSSSYISPSNPANLNSSTNQRTYASFFVLIDVFLVILVRRKLSNAEVW